MDFKDILGKLDQLNEAEMTSRKVSGRAYGGSAQADDDDDDEDGTKKATAPAVKRGRGRPRKAGGEAQTKAGYGGAAELQRYIVGSVPKKSKELEKLPKTKHKLPDVEPTAKKKVKEHFTLADQLREAEQLTIEPAKQNTQVIKQGTKTLGTVSNPQLAAQIKQSIGKGEMSLAGSELGEADYSAKAARAGKDIGKPGKQFAKIAKSAGEKYGSKERGEKVAGAVLAKLRKTNEADMPPNDALASPLTLESQQDVAEGKKKVAEGMDQRMKAAHHRGKAHALAKENYNCRYDEGSEEARMYHEGYKMGLDECYGIMPMRGVVVGEESDIVDDMASFGAHTPEVEEGNAFTAALAKTPQGGKFSVGGKTFTDTSGYDSNIDEMMMAFEGWDKQLNALLTEGEKVDEGMSVSVSKGQQGMPDSVSITANDGEADKLLSLVKQLGVFGSEESHSDYGSPETPVDIVSQHGDLTVVDDHDGMMGLIKKMSGGDDESHDSHDYADEHGSEEEVCGNCGMNEAACGCNEEHVMDEEETEDQREFQVAEDDESDESEDDESDEELDESFANSADDTFEADMDFMTKVISGGVNKQKSTGQTTVPVIPGQNARMGADGMNEDADSIMDWKKLAGI